MNSASETGAREFGVIKDVSRDRNAALALVKGDRRRIKKAMHVAKSIVKTDPVPSYTNDCGRHYALSAELSVQRGKASYIEAGAA